MAGVETQRRINFEHGQLIEGDIEELKSQIRTILPEWSDVEFSNSISTYYNDANLPLIPNAKLDFFLSYVFESLYFVESPGCLDELHQCGEIFG